MPPTAQDALFLTRSLHETECSHIVMPSASVGDRRVALPTGIKFLPPVRCVNPRQPYVIEMTLFLIKEASVMLKEVTGDILLSTAGAIAHGIAPHDNFKQGLALSLRERWPGMYKDFATIAKPTVPKRAAPGPGKARIPRSSSICSRKSRLPAIRIIPERPPCPT